MLVGVCVSRGVLCGSEAGAFGADTFKERANNVGEERSGTVGGNVHRQLLFYYVINEVALLI